MADKITSLTKVENHWDVSYEVEKNSLKNSFCVTVLKSEMTDPDSDTEARTLANTKAAAIKNAWEAVAPEAESFIEAPENVTL